MQNIVYKIVKNFQEALQELEKTKIFYSFRTSDSDRALMTKNDFNVVFLLENQKRQTVVAEKKEVEDSGEEVEGEKTKKFIYKMPFISVVNISIITYKRGTGNEKDNIAHDMLQKMVMATQTQVFLDKCKENNIEVIRKPFNIQDLSKVESTQDNSIERYDFKIETRHFNEIEMTEKVFDSFILKIESL